MTKTNWWIILSLILLSLVLYVLTVPKYPGHWIGYLVYSGLLDSLLIIGLTQKKSYTILFLSVFLWLGFLLKTSFFLHFKHLTESIGDFKGSPQDWNYLAKIVSVGVSGVFSAIMFLNFFKKSNRIRGENLEKNCPWWFLEYRKTAYGILILSITVFSTCNLIYGVHIVGLLPGVSWNFMVLKSFSWLMLNGFAIIITSFLFWDFALGRDIKVGFYSLVYEAFMINTFQLSRGFVFHIIPQVFSWFEIRDLKINKKFFVGLCFIVMLSFVFSMKVVRQFREDYFDRVMTAENSRIDLNRSESVLFSSFAGKTLNLVINRWIGLEGVMAVSSTSDLGWPLFKRGFLDIAQPGKASIFDQLIAKTEYVHSNKGRIQFGSLPGGIAFFFFSGSYFVTFIGMFVLTIVGFLIEETCFFLTKNFFLCAYVGANIALAISQFGYQPLKFFAYQLAFILSFMLIGWMQGNCFLDRFFRIKLGKYQK